jgi:type II secretory pathway pseudopilin PulG
MDDPKLRLDFDERDPPRTQGDFEKRENEPPRPKQFTLIELLAVIGIIGILIGLLLPAVSRVHAPAMRIRSQNNLKMQAIGILDYEAAHSRYPADVYEADGTPWQSWRIELLPFIEQTARYRQYRFDEPWGSIHNLAVSQPAPQVFIHPYQKSADDTHYRGFCGPGALFEPRPETCVPFGESHVTDGISNTLALAECDVSVKWMAPSEIDSSPSATLPSFGNLYPKKARVFYVAMLDGSVRLVPAEYRETDLRGLITVAGGESVVAP